MKIKPLIILSSVLIFILSAVTSLMGEGFYAAVFMVLMLTAAIIFGIFGSRFNNALLCLIIVILFSLRLMSVYATEDKLKGAHGQTGEASFIIIEPSSQNGTGKIGNIYCTAMLTKTSLSCIQNDTKVLLYLNEGDEMLDIGDTVSGRFYFQRITDNMSFKSRNILLSASPSSDYTVFGTDKVLYKAVRGVRDYIRTTLRSFTNNSDIITAMLFGERKYVSDSFIDAAKGAGVCHIMVVSGLHFTILCGALKKLLDITGLGNTVKDILLVLFVIAFAALCGFTTPVMRSVVFYLSIIIYKNIKRLSKPVIILGLSAVTVMFIHPFAFYDVTFLLSFSATFGILTIYPVFNNYINLNMGGPPFLKGLIQCCLITISSTITTFPICTGTFGFVSTVSVFANLAVSWSVTALLLCSSAALIFSLIPYASFISSALFFITDVLASYFKKVTVFFGSLPFSVVYFKNIEWLVAISIMLIAVWYEKYTCKSYRHLLKLIKRR